MTKRIGSLLGMLLLLVVAGCNSKYSGLVDPANYEAPVKVACVGNSITFGYGIENRDSLSYPAQLQRLLGRDWQVVNFGVSGRTLLLKGDLPYVNEQAYSDVKAFLPDVVLIKLGTNDTKPGNWEYQSEFKNDYKNLINSFRALPSKPMVILIKPVPAFPERWGITDSVIVNGVIPKVEQLAVELDCPVIDLYSPFIGKGNLFPDAIHPNAEGAGLIAAIIAARLTGQTDLVQN